MFYGGGCLPDIVVQLSSGKALDGIEGVEQILLMSSYTTATNTREEKGRTRLS